jgi:hypothetical protein
VPTVAPTSTPLVAPRSSRLEARPILWGGILLFGVGALSLGAWQVVRSRRAKQQRSSEPEP